MKTTKTTLLFTLQLQTITLFEIGLKRVSFCIVLIKARQIRNLTRIRNSSKIIMIRTELLEFGGICQNQTLNLHYWAKIAKMRHFE